MPPLPRRCAVHRAPILGLVLLCVGFGVVGCMEVDGLDRHEGGPGYACYFDADCALPLVCEETPAAVFPVCTGTALPGQSCGGDVACAWLRDTRGLPLACSSAGLCEWPADVRATTAGP